MSRTGRPRSFDLTEAVDAALQLFWRHGYEATSLAQLRAAMGLSSASFYAAFGSKEALFVRVVERYLETYGSVREAGFDPSLSPREALARFLRDSARMQTDPDHPLGCLIIFGGASVAEGNDAISEVLAERRAQDRAMLVSCVQRGIREGELAPDTNAAGLADVFASFLWGLSIEARDGTPTPRIEAAVDHLMALWDR